jgi:hypothetical protein
VNEIVVTAEQLQSACPSMNSTCNSASVTLGRRSSRCSAAQSGTVRALAATAFGVQRRLELGVRQTLDTIRVESDRGGASQVPVP